MEHNKLIELDKKYSTPTNSPLHHNNRWCNTCSEKTLVGLVERPVRGGADDGALPTVIWEVDGDATTIVWGNYSRLAYDRDTLWRKVSA